MEVIKNVKKINLLFLIMVIISVSAELFFSLIATASIKLPFLLNVLLSQSFIIVPGLVFVLINRNNDSFKIDLKGIKIVNVILMIAFTELIMPIASAANVFSQLFTKNEMLGVSDQMTALPAPVIVLIAGMLAPFCEEFVFRGILFTGLRKSTGRVIASGLLSAAFFGLFHLNFNQMCYAFILGLIFAVVDDVLGSIWPSVIMHCTINTQNVLMLFFSDYVMKNTNGISVSSAYEQTYNSQIIVIMLIFMIAISIVTSILAVLLFYGICSIEGRVENLKAVIKRPETKVRVLTAAGIVGIAVCMFVIFILEPVAKFIASKM